MKKHWISIKRGLSEDPKHRSQMGECIWLFMHIIDRADWETGIAYDWKDAVEAKEMSMPLPSLRHQRRKLEDAGYITCKQGQQKQDIIIHEWVDPRNYSGKIINSRKEEKVDGDHKLSPSKVHGDHHGYNHGDNHVDSQVITPTSDSTSTLTSEQLEKITKAADKELDFLLKQNQLSAGRSWTKLPEIYHPFGRAVCGSTGLEYSKKNFHEWVSTFEDWMAQRCQPEDVVKAMEQVNSEGKASWISSPRSLTHWVIGQKTARLTRENKAVENSMAQGENVVLPAWMQADYENVG